MDEDACRRLAGTLLVGRDAGCVVLCRSGCELGSREDDA